MDDFAFFTVEFLQTIPGQVLAAFLLTQAVRSLYSNASAVLLRGLAMGVGVGLQVFFAWWTGKTAPHYVLAFFAGLFIGFAAMQGAVFLKPILEKLSPALYRILFPSNGTGLTPPQGTAKPQGG